MPKRTYKRSKRSSRSSSSITSGYSYSNPLTVLGVDPPNALAVVRGDAMLFHGSFRKNPSYRKNSFAISELMELAMVHKPDIIAIEDQWIDLRRGPDGKLLRRLDTPLILSRKSGLWVYAWFEHGGETEPEFLEPGEWQKPVIGGRAAAKGTNAERKFLAQAVIRHIYGPDLDEDEVDAAGVARSKSLRLVA